METIARLMVDQQALAARAREGDGAAFTALAQRYQQMALGYALAILGDFHLAQDVTQEALLAAYRGLPALQDTARFPAWLRGIVRLQCSHARRRRSVDLAPLDQAWEIPAATLGPEQQVEVAEGFHRVLAAIRSLPASQREVAMLYFVKDYSHREIASFLELPATTVNNRLHAARKALRERLLMNEKHGRVIAAQDVVIDVEFATEHTPLILAGLRVGDAGDGQAPVLQVVQRVRDGLVRCLARGDLAGITPGAAVVDTGEPLLAPLDAESLTRVLPLFGPPGPATGNAQPHGSGERPALLETGIKVIDLLCPFARGGTVGIFGPNGTGRMVISAEIVHNLAREHGGITIYAFLNGELEGRALYDAPDEAPRPTDANRIIFLPIDNSIDIASPAALAASPLLDTRIYLSFTVAKSGIWPAIDPLLSTARLMDPAILGQEHYDVARGVRDLLRRQRELLEGAFDGRTMQLTPADRLLIARARKIQRFFSQPFAVAAPFTGRAGQVVPLAETIRGCRAILAGQYDGMPEEAFLWRGALDVPPDVTG